MNGEWTTLGEYITIQGGYAYKSEDFNDTGNCQVLKIKNVRFGHISYNDTAFINENLAQATEAWRTKEGDILISMTGSGPNAPQSLVGRVARVWKNEPAAYINQRVGRVKLKKSNSIHSDFVFYLLSQKSSQEYLVSNSSGSANQANINGKTIESLPCPKIDFYTSQKIGRVLRQLDEKIILNRQINQTLEEMARALFKSWFVDFEPVWAKVAALESGEDTTRAAMRAISGKTDDELDTFQISDEGAYAQLQTTASLFPDEFEESELGLVPKGWVVKSLDSIANFLNGLALQKFPPDSEQDYLPVIKIAQLKKGDSSGADKASAKLKKEYIVNNGDVLFSWSGSLEVDIWCGGHGALNQHLFKVTSTIYPKWFYYCWTLYHLEHFKAIAAGKAVTMGHIQRRHLTEALCVVPKVDTIEYLGQLIDNLIIRIIQLRTEIRSLTTVRDTLLPKLLSGELSVFNSEVEAEAIG